MISDLHGEYPEKELIASEACSKRGLNRAPYSLAWFQGEDYSKNIIQNLKHSTTTWIDWNLALNTEGGPNWAGNRRNAAVIIDADKERFYIKIDYY